MSNDISSSAMLRIHALTLTNFRCFEAIDVSLDENMTVFVAPNGGGKTAILDAIRITLTPFVRSLGEADGRTIHQTDVRATEVFADASAKIPGPPRDVAIRANGMLLAQTASWAITRRAGSGTSYREASSPKKLAAEARKHLYNELESRSQTLPLVAAYGTTRHSRYQPGRLKRSAMPLVSRAYGYNGWSSAISKFDVFQKWFASAYLSVLLGRYEGRRGKLEEPEHQLLEGMVDNVRRVVRAALKPYSEQCWLEYRTSDREVVVNDHERDTQLTLSQLSDGVQMAIGLFGDIASRASTLNPQFGAEASAKTPGIVLIDEIDLHLHPHWQQLVLQSLREAFPLVQFIVTTHSPQVLTTLAKENIRILQSDSEGAWTALPPSTSPLGKESGDALALIMGTHPRPNLPQVLPDIHTYEALARSGRMHSREATEVRARLDAAGFEFSTAEEDLFQFLSKKAAKTEDHGE